MTERDWSRCVGPGWVPLVEALADLADLYGAEILQVKEKFGGLCFYFSGGGEKHAALRLVVDAAQAASLHICEDCGERGWETDPAATANAPKQRSKARLRSIGYWLCTLCDRCEATRKEKEQVTPND